MKKVSTLLFSLACAGFVTGQTLTKAPSPVSQSSDFKSEAMANAKAAPKANYIKKAGAACPNYLYQYDFSTDPTTGATPWTLSGDKASSLWEYRGVGTTPDVTTGSRGAYAQGQPLLSPTASNGFMIFDSDYLDNNGIAGNFGQGTAPAPHFANLISPVMDFSATPNVSMEMNDWFRPFQAEVMMLISIDGGVTYNDTIHFHDGQSTNSATTNGGYNYFDISSEVGGESNVVVNFFFDGRLCSSGSACGYYYWMVDDIAFLETPKNDLEISDLYFGWEFVYDTSYFNYYSMIPQKHAKRDSIQFSGNVFNKGSESQSNVKMNLDVNANGVWNTSSSMGISVAAGATDSVGVSDVFVPSMGTGTYMIDAYPSSDSSDCIPKNDTLRTSIDITDSIYARYKGNSAGGTQWGGGYIIGQTFDFLEADEVSAVEILWFGWVASDGTVNGTPAGETVKIKIYDASFTEVAATGFVTPDETLYRNDLWQRFEFDQPVSLPRGTYLIGYETYTNDVWFSVESFDDHAQPQTVFVDPGKAGTWFFTSRVPYLRVITDPFSCQDFASAPAGTQTTACGAADGTASVNPTGGTSPYTYFWQSLTSPGFTITTGMGQGTNSVNSLQAGSYEVAIVDANGCTENHTIAVTDAGAPLISNDVVTDSDCFGDLKGGISIDVNGGTGTPSFMWSDGSTSEDLTGVDPGMYTLTITDQSATPCLQIESWEIEGPSAPLSSIENVTDATTNGSEDGELDITLGGGTRPYTIDVTNNKGYTYNYTFLANENTHSILNLDEGSYDIDVTDGNNCTIATSASIVTTNGTNVNELLDGQTITTFPNPTNGTFNVNVQGFDAKVVLTLQNAIGQTVMNRVMNNNSMNTLELSELNKGVYFMTITSGDVNYSERVILK